MGKQNLAQANLFKEYRVEIPSQGIYFADNPFTIEPHQQPSPGQYYNIIKEKCPEENILNQRTPPANPKCKKQSFHQKAFFACCYLCDWNKQLNRNQQKQ